MKEKSEKEGSKVTLEDRERKRERERERGWEREVKVRVCVRNRRSARFKPLREGNR